MRYIYATYPDGYTIRLTYSESTWLVVRQAWENGSFVSFNTVTE
jgi:hypothetical protein